MPQGRKKMPYSGKAKKIQLHNKRVSKAYVPLVGDSSNNEHKPGEQEILKINVQPFSSSKKSTGCSRFGLHFFHESEEIVKKGKEDAYLTLTIAKTPLEINAEEYYSHEVDFPKRPSWSHKMSRDELDRSEQKYFREYISKVEECSSDISFFDLNLENWRQFWRVLEMSDILLIIVDIRFPSLMFPPSLHNYVMKTLGKSMVLVLNKIDLVPAPVVVSWKSYFNIRFPSMHVILFSSFPQYSARRNIKKSGWFCGQKKKIATEGAQSLLNICAKIVDGKVDLSSWQKKISQEISENETPQEETECVQEEYDVNEEYEIYRHGLLTIGCIGFPNAGKSSVMNALIGKKVVSTSKTPGHTKYFQTIYLAQTVKLCDCPGLVFPSLIPKHLLVLMGSFPIAQLRNPYSTIKFLAENVDLMNLLSLKHPTGDDTWSAYDICTAWANRRGFLTAKSARPDTYRAANHILRLALDGKITLYCHPRGYFNDQDVWDSHEDTQALMHLYGDQNTGSAGIPESLSGSEESIQSCSSQTSEDSDNENPCTSQKNKFSVLEDED